MSRTLDRNEVLARYRELAPNALERLKKWDWPQQSYSCYLTFTVPRTFLGIRTNRKILRFVEFDGWILSLDPVCLLLDDLSIAIEGTRTQRSRVRKKILWQTEDMIRLLPEELPTGHLAMINAILESL